MHFCLNPKGVQQSTDRTQQPNRVRYPTSPADHKERCVVSLRSIVICRQWNEINTQINLKTKSNIYGYND